MGKRDESNKIRKKCMIAFLITLVIGLIIEIICDKTKVFSGFSFSRMLVISTLIWYAAIHFIVGFKRLYTIMIDNRFLISFVMIILTTLVEMPQNPDGILDSLISPNTRFGLIWNIRFYALLLVSFEMFRIITKDSKYISFFGALILVFSGHVQYMFNFMNTLIIGEFGFVCVKKYFDYLKKVARMPDSESFQIGRIKLDSKFWPVLIVITGVLYSLTYESFAISYGYVFLGLIVWQIIIDWKELKKIGSLKIALIPLLVVLFENIIVKGFLYKNNEQMIMYGRGVFGIFDYLYTVFIPFKNIAYGEMLASIVSLYPIPLLIALLCLYKDEKHIEFLLPMAVVCVFESITYFSNGEGIFETINKISLFSMVNVNVLLCAINYSNLLMIFYFITNYDEKIFSFKVTIRLTLIISIVAFMMLNRPDELASDIYKYLLITEFVLLLFTFLNYDDKKYRGLFIATLLIISVLTGSSVNSVIRDKNNYLLFEDVDMGYDQESDEMYDEEIYEDGEIYENGEIYEDEEIYEY